jgi:WD40 repeat protein
VALFDALTFAPLAMFEAPEERPVSGIAFSPDGTQMAVCTQGPEIRLWNLMAIRHQLAGMNLDFDLPAGSPSPRDPRPLRIAVE